MNVSEIQSPTLGPSAAVQTTGSVDPPQLNGGAISKVEKSSLIRVFTQFL